MSAPVNANINVVVNTSQATAQLRSLQSQIATLNKSLIAGSSSAAAQQSALNRALMDGANASRMWSARMVPMTTATDQFSQALDKGKMSLGQYARYAGSQLPGMSRIFKREFEMMSNVAEQNVRRMQTQYVSLGNSASGAAQAMALTPMHLNKHAAGAEIAAQRQMMMNRMIDLGSTKLLNWGKNTQWAGRQLMVGFTLPLGLMGAAAAKAFKEIDKSEISFKRVYGNLETTTAEMEKNLSAVKDLGIEYTKYGKSLQSTIELSAKVAATGAQDETLLAATEETIRLATLGLMEYDEALGATIALQTAFGVSNEDLTSTIDFLNVVENETILTMQDMAAAIPRVAPVVKGLGGDVKDLAVFMTAMREGGITAEQGANALKSGLGRLINPTKAAREEMAKYNISIDAITQKNKGDLMATIQDFGTALSTLGDFEQQQVLQKVFGTYQYARLGALFKNIVRDSGQAQRTLELTGMSVEDLASISERELGKIEEATSTKFEAAMERLKISIAPIGEIFMKAIMPIIDFVAKIANAFNELPEGIKNAIAIAVAAIAGIGPIVLMTIGLFANGIANIAKLVQTLRKFFARLKGDSRLFEHLTVQEREARMAADGLSGSTERLTGKFLGQQKALERLTQLLGTYSSALRSVPSTIPMGGTGGKPTAAPASAPSGPRGFFSPMGRMLPPRKFAKGVTQVPGVGNEDTIPALLTPGESVLTKEATKKYAPFIAAMNAGTIKMMATAGAAQGSLPAAPAGTYSQSQGNTLVRSHVMGLGPQSLIPNFIAALSSLNPIIQQYAQEVLSTTKAVELYKSGQDLLARELSETSGVLDALQRSASGVTAGFRGTAMASPQTVNEVYNRMPANLKEGDALSLKTFQQQVRWAENEFRELAQILGVTTQELSDDATINQTLDQTTRQRVEGLRLLINEGRDVAIAQMTEEEFLESRIKQIGLSIEAEKGQRNATVANTNAERFATEQMILLRNAGVVATGATINYAEAMKILAASAIRQAGAVVVGGSDINQQYVKRGSQRLAPSSVPVGQPKKISNLRSIPTSTIPVKQNRFTDAALAINANRFAAQAGRGVAEATVRGANQGFGNASPSVKAQQAVTQYVDGIELGARNNSPQAAAAGKVVGDSFSSSVRTAMAQANAAGSSGTGPMKISYSPDAKKQMEALNSKSVATSGSLFKSTISAIFKEVGNIFRVLPQLGYELLRNFKEPMKIFGNIISQIAGPYVKPIVDAFKFLKDTVVLNVKTAAALIANDIKKIPGILKGAANAFATKISSSLKDAYTMAALRTSIAMDSIKSIPAKIKSSYETAALRLMMGLDSIKKLPETIKKQVSMLQGRFATLREEFSNQARRFKNKAFYGQQDIRGRISERFAGIRERFGASAGASAAALREGDPRTAARAFVPDRAAAQVKTMSQQIVNATNIIKNRLTETATNVANSARLAKILLKDGDARGALRAITPDKIAQAFSAATKPIMDAGRFVQKNLLDAGRVVGKNLVDAGKFIGGKVSDAATKLTAAGQNLANSLKVAGSALAMRDPKTALRALTPDRLAAALGSARSRAGEMLGAARTRVGGVAASARATGITAYNAMLARDIKTFAKALTPDKIWKASSDLANTISQAGKSIGVATKFAYNTILFNAKAAIALGPSIIKDGFFAVRSGLISGAKFVRDTMVVNVRAALFVGASEMKKAFAFVKTSVSQGGKFILDTVRMNIGAALIVAKGEITRIAGILRTEGPKLKVALTQAGQGIVGAIKGAGGVLSDSIKSVGSLIKTAGAAAAQSIRGIVSGGVDSQGRSRGQRMAGVGNNAMMGMMGVSMAASFLPGEMGELAQKIMPVTMGFMMLQMLLPMLTSPLGILVLVAGGLAAGFIYLRKQLDDAAKAAAEMGANIGGVANGMTVIEEATGFKAPDQDDRLFRFTDKDREAMGQFGAYFESESGSKFIQDLRESTSEERYQKVSTLLAQGIASGLEKEKAEAFGKAIAEATGDAMLNSNLARDFANQIFDSGAQALVDLEKKRIEKRPDSFIPADFTRLGNGVGAAGNLMNPILGAPESPMDAAKRAATTGGVAGGLLGTAGVMAAGGLAASATGVGVVVGVPLKIAAGFVAATAAIVGGIAAIDAYRKASEETKKTTESAAKALGFALQTTKNLANAEAVLEEERRNGLIDFPEYQKQLEELNGLQKENAAFIGQAFDLSGVDTGAMMQALESQLSFSGFTEDQVKNISKEFSPDALSKQLFGKDTFKELSKEEQAYVEDVFQETMTGLTPENISQRLEDLRGTWTNIKDDIIKAMIESGSTDIDYKDYFQKDNFSAAIADGILGGIDIGTTYAKDVAGAAPGGGTAKAGETYTPSDFMAFNLQDADMDLKELKTDAEEVLTLLLKFKDTNISEAILLDPEAIRSFGSLVSGLKDLPGIDLESVFAMMAESGLTADQAISGIKSSVDAISKIKLSKKLFGAATLDAQALTDSLVEFSDEMGLSLTDIPKRVEEQVDVSTQRIKNLSEDAFDELGNIKITPEIVATLFGTDEKTAEGLANSLKSAFPTNLPPAALPIFLSLMNPEMLTALANLSPAAAAAIEGGATAGTSVVTAPGTSFASSYTLTDQDILAYQSSKSAKEIAESFIPSGEDTTVPEDTKGGGSSGGADKQKTALQEMIAALNATLKLYGTAKTLTKKVLKSKKEMNKFFKELSFDEGISDQLRAMNLSETLIADLLSKGGKNASKIMKALGETGLKRLDKVTTLARAGQRVEEVQTREEREGYKATARTRLEKDGTFTKEEIDQILENEQDVEMIAKFPIKKNQDEWKITKDALQRDARIELTVEPKPDLEKFEEIAQEISKGFDAVEQKARDGSYASFFTNNSKLAGQLAKTQKTSIDNGYDLVDAINKQIDANERALNVQQDIVDSKQEEINDYQRANDLIQQGIDNLRRQDEMRNRVSEGLTKELETMSNQEQKIREAYDEKIKSLEKVELVNQRIINQEKDKLGISQALAEGDIFAATEAARQAKQNQVQASQEDFRNALEQGMENQIAGLRTSGGLTREEAEAQIASIKEQSYQTTLLIRAEEDRIHVNNLEVRRLSNEIYNINENMIEPLQNQNKEYARILDYRAKDEEYAVRGAALAGLTREEWERRADEIENSLQPTKDLTTALEGVAAAYRDIYRDALLASGAAGSLPNASVPSVGSNIGGVNSSIDLSALPDLSNIDWSLLDLTGVDLGFNAGGIAKYNTGGAVIGEGTRDSVKAMLTPGEFVVRKAMVNKYGIPMLNDLNQGSFSMPKYKTPESSDVGEVKAGSNSATNVVAPMYNNYSVSVNVSGTNASADEIANRTITKIKQMQNTSIRSGRG